MKFFAEAYNFKLISDLELWTLLYRMINIDYEKGKEIKEEAEADSKDESFRIRMVCTCLDSLGKFFSLGPKESSLDRFLVFFQRYIHSKNYILMDLEFMILDCFDHLGFRGINSHEEAEEICQKVEEAEANDKTYQFVLAHIDDSKGESFLDCLIREDKKSNQASQKRKESLVEASLKSAAPQNQKYEQAAKLEEEDAELDLEFKIMLEEAAEQARKEQKQAKKEIVIPLNKAANPFQALRAGQHVQFTFLQRKGNKTTASHLDIPADSRIVSSTKLRMKEEDEEKRRAKEHQLRLIQEQQHWQSEEEDEEAV